MEHPFAESFTYGVSVLGSGAALLTAVVAIVGGIVLGRLFRRPDSR